MTFLLDHDVPEDLSYLLIQLGHEVHLLRTVLPTDAPDDSVLRAAHANGSILVTCNRDDFLALAATQPHHGIVIVVRRRTRASERAALLNYWMPLERAEFATTSTSPEPE